MKDELLKMKDELLKVIPEDIMKKGFKSKYDYNGFAFYATEIMELAKIFNERNISILGGDVMILNDQQELENSPTRENWYLNPNNENYDVFVNKSIEKMCNYVTALSKEYPDFLYMPCLADKSTLENLEKIEKLNEQKFNERLKKNIIENKKTTEQFKQATAKSKFAKFGLCNFIQCLKDGFSRK